MEDMGSVGDTGMVRENGGLRDLNVIWTVVVVVGANPGLSRRSRDEMVRPGRTGRLLPFQLRRRGDFELGNSHVP
jgi:hypothetical protein